MNDIKVQRGLLKSYILMGERGFSDSNCLSILALRGLDALADLSFSSFSSFII